ncbi:MAG: arsenate reductase [Melioribacteraceae bacterium]|nr:MAG: arsenate reductase [Melioribacteraceae bacterium]
MISNQLSDYIDQVESNFDSIPEGRKNILSQIIDYITKHQSRETINLNFICTHNSRRSIISQIWAQVAAYYYGVDKIVTWSGGTEATAFNPRAVKAIRSTGVSIKQTSDSENPRYQVEFAREIEPLVVFSKKYNDPFNPQSEFCAVMTCDSADEACPVVFGSDARVALTYKDPKEFDGTEKEAQMYAKRTFEIATEIFWMFSQIAEK